LKQAFTEDIYMEKRQFGRTGHNSTVAIFGAAALGQVSQEEADTAIQQVLAAGVNHIDVAPSYGDAEARLGSWMKAERDKFFLGCKTMERTKADAWKELHQSLERLNVDSFDLYQFHAVTKMEELDLIFQAGGALEAFLEAKEEGLIKHIGITGHGLQAPSIYLEALRRFDFDSVLFPINPVLFGFPEYRQEAEALIRTCREKNVGTMVIKSITRGPWKDQEHTYHTWYEPFTEMEDIQAWINFALSQEITGICTAGDVRLLPKVLQACENFTPLAPQAQQYLIQQSSVLESLFT
jgi:aryl-alcohol dehydrogenase-like predicted oxidoreductase